MPSNDILSPIVWREGKLCLLDQRLLPTEELWIECADLASVIEAIKEMVVRGAPAIGISAAYGAVIALSEVGNDAEAVARKKFTAMMDELASARPTAVNLGWAVSEVKSLFALSAWADFPEALFALAKQIHESDVDANLRMGELGREMMAADHDGTFSVLTHCNTGSLATGGYGTALGVIRSAWAAGMIDRVYADETRPWLQGARLTAWELQRDGIPVVLNADSAAAWLMAKSNVRWVVVGADRITANGDVANKIGTYSLAVLAKYHGVRFMVVAPTSTVDMALASGEEIEIEERVAAELTMIGNKQIAPRGIDAVNPVFDVTPAELVDVIVTERGVVENPTRAKMEALFL